MAEISLSELGSNLATENQQGFSGLVAPVENAPQEHFNTMDWVDSIWQTGNSVRAAEAYVASITDTQHIPDIPEENMYESLKPYAGYLDRFNGVTSAREVAQIKSRIDNEMLNGRVMSEHGFWSNLLMTVPAALGDPLNLVGFGEAAAPLKLANAARTVEMAQNVARFAKGVARVAAEMTPSTLALYATSETQTPADLALNYSLGLGLAGMIHSVPYVKKAMTEKGVSLEDTAVAATHLINAEKSMGAAEARTTGIAQHEEGRTPEQIMQDMQVVGESVISKTGQQFIDPLYRAQTASVPEARVAAAALNDSHLMTREMLPTVDENGVITDWGREKQVSVQAIARGFIGAHESAVADMRSFYQAYRVATGHAAPKSHTVTVIGDFVTRPKGLMTIDEFSEKVAFATRNDDTAIKSSDPEADKYVTEAAKSFRQKVYNPIFERAKEAGLIDEDVELKTSASYLNRIYDVDKIVANRGAFSQKISNYLIGRRAVVEEMLPKMTDELKKLYDTQSSVMAKVKENDIILDHFSRIDKLNKLEKEMKDIASEPASKVNKLRMADIKNEIDYIENANLENIAKENESHSHYIRKLSRQILMKHESLDVANELLSGNVQKLTDEIFHKITGTGGRLSNSFDTEVGARGSALERTLGIQDSEIQDFLQNDIRLASEQYAKTLGMDVALTEKFGDPAMTATLDKIKQQYQEKMSGLEGKPLIKMQKEMNNVIKSIEGNRDRLRGTFERPDRDQWFSELMHRAAFFAKSANTLNSMGGTLVASLGDPMNMIMTYGLSSFLRDGLVPLVKSLSSSKAANLSADELKLGGTALEIERSGVWGAKNEVWDGEGSDTVAEKALKSMTRTFGFVSLVAPWNQMMKRVAGTIVQNNVLKNVMRYESLSAKEIRDLNQIGIGKEKALAIKEQISRLESEGHVMDQDGVLLARSKMWDDAKLQEHYRSAIASEVDRIHVTPGGEKPLFMSTALGSVIMQFKTFIIASHHRIILAGLQRHDANFLQGIIGLTAMGMLIYKLKKGDKVSDKPQDWIREGLDRGGVLGWFMEANNMVSGATGGQADIFRLIGAEKPVSRYQTRGAVGSLLGRTFGATQDSYSILRDIAKGEVDQSTMHKARTLLPFQNVFYAKGIMDTGEENISAYFGGM